MRQVREMLGPDALIVSNRSVEGGVEVLACADADLPEADAVTPLVEASTAAPATPPDFPVRPPPIKVTVS